MLHTKHSIDAHAFFSHFVIVYNCVTLQQLLHHVTWSLVLCVCFIDRCLSFFFWTLYCLFFLDIRILITSLVSSNSSGMHNICQWGFAMVSQFQMTEKFRLPETVFQRETHKRITRKKRWKENNTTHWIEGYSTQTQLKRMNSVFGPEVQAYPTCTTYQWLCI